MTAFIDGGRGSRGLWRAARGSVALAAAAALAIAPAGPANAADRARWDTKVFAHVPAPGFPAHAYVRPDGTVFEGTYVNPNGDRLPSKVLAFDGAGKPAGEWTVTGQDLGAEHGVQVATSDAAGRLVLLDRTPSRALILDPKTGSIATYAEFPDVPICSSGAPVTACQPTLHDSKPFADYAAWGPDGSLYVTDYAQAVIWKVPPGGGTPEIWLADRRLDGQLFGTAGIALTADEKGFLFTQASSLGVGGLANPTTGKLYYVPFTVTGGPGGLEQRWESAAGSLPDGFAIAKSGAVYVAEVGLSAQLVRVAPDGTEERFPKTPGTGDNGSGVPFDSPSSAAFLGTRLIVANQSAVAGTVANQVLFDVEAAEPGLPELIPANAGPPVAPRTDARDTRNGVAKRAGKRGLVVTLTRGVAGAPARVRVTARGRTLGTGTLKRRTLRLTLRSGVAELPRRWTIRPLKPGAKLAPTRVLSVPRSAASR